MKVSKVTKSNNDISKAKLPIVLYRGFSGGKNWKVEWMSPTVIQSTGFSAKQHLDSEFWFSRLHEDDKEIVVKKFKDIFSGEADAIEVSYRWLCKDGKYHWFLDRAELIRDSKGKPSELLGSWVDISAHVKAEKTLIENEEHYKELVKLCPYAIYVQSEGKFVFLNSAAVKLFEAEREEEVTGKPLSSFIHPDYHALLNERLNILNIERKDVPLVEFKIVTLKGNVKNVEITSTPFTYEGKTASQGVILDVSKYKQSEEFLRGQTEELEQLNRLLLKRQLSSMEANPKINDTCSVLFEGERGVLLFGDREVRIQKFSKQYSMLEVMFKDTKCVGQDWQFSEISELMDIEAEFDWKKLYNIADAVRKKIAIDTGIKDFFFLNTQSVKINPKYLTK